MQRASISHLLLSTLYCICLLLPYGAQAQTVERLFLTPAERAYLEQLRIRSLRPQPPVQEAEPEPQPESEVVLEPEELLFSHGGTLLRTDGTYTIWLNDRAYAQNQLPENVELVSPYTQGQLRITNAQTGQSYLLKPGQVLNLNTGQLRESYEPRFSIPESAQDADQ